jgi:hypothetical protein
MLIGSFDAYGSSSQGDKRLSLVPNESPVSRPDVAEFEPSLPTHLLKPPKTTQLQTNKDHQLQQILQHVM